MEYNTSKKIHELITIPKNGRGGWMLFFIEECQLIHVEEMIVLEYNHLDTTNIIIQTRIIKDAKITWWNREQHISWSQNITLVIAC